MSDVLPPFRVLCLDGGGMRGFYTASVLNGLVKRRHPGKSIDIGQSFDLIVGTSTGGILAAGLAYGEPIENILKLYRDFGKNIFPNPVPGRQGENKGGLIGWINSADTFSRWGAWLKRRKGSANTGNAALKRALDRVFGDTTLESLYLKRKISLCIPAIVMSTQKAWVFKTPHIPKKTRDNHYRLTDVCLATSAAPIVLPLVAIDRPDDDGQFDVFVDGGLWANNPTLIGMIEALEITNSSRDVEIISVGTASPPAGKQIAKNEVNFSLFGTKGWNGGIGALETALNAQASGTEFISAFLSKHLKTNVRIIRLPYMPPSEEQGQKIGLDRSDDDALQVMGAMARHDVEQEILGISNRLKTEDYERLLEIIDTMNEKL